MTPHRLYVFDLDGTLYRGSSPIPHAVETVAELRRRGAMIRYLTNNSGATRADLVAKLRGMGFEAEPEETYTSALGAAELLGRHGIDTAFVVGEAGLFETLEQTGIRTLGRERLSSSHPVSAPVDPAPAVVAAIARSLTYHWLDEALQHLLGGALFVAINRDATYPLETRFQPGSGTMVAALAWGCGREPEVVGKPNPLMIERILSEAGVRAEETLVVGDRPETDLACGRNAGCATWQVLSGVSDRAEPGQPHSADLRALLS